MIISCFFLTILYHFLDCKMVYDLFWVIYVIASRGLKWLLPNLRHDFIFIGLFFSLSASCMLSVMTSETRQSFVSLWKPVEAGGSVPLPCGLSSLLSPPTVMLRAQNPSSEHQEASRKKMEFCYSRLGYSVRRHHKNSVCLSLETCVARGNNPSLSLFLTVSVTTLQSILC